MEPNKLENSFRDQLNKREMQPSEMAWDRLDAMLSVSENKKPKKRKWMYIAASFLGFMLIGSLFFNQSETEIKTNGTIVNQENIESQTENTSQEQSSPVSSSTITAVQPSQNAIASVISSSKKGSKASKENSSISQKGTEEVQIIEEKMTPDVKPNKYIESESLLAEAETKLQTEAIKSSVAKSGVRVSSKSLLSSVEGELDATFKEKVVRSIGKNYESVKSTLATRNQE
jgi:hypothetical protein